MTRSSAEQSAKHARLRQAGSRHLAIVVVCFLVSALSYVGATVFANSRLGQVTDLTRNATENAMPTLAEIGIMRYELANIERALEGAIDTGGADFGIVEEHLRTLEGGKRRYEALPQFATEPDVWARTRPMVDEAERSANRVISDLRMGLPRTARGELTGGYLPAATPAESSLERLRRINLDEGTTFAHLAEASMHRARVASILLGCACALFTGILAYVALRSSRRAVAAEARRADELDAFAARVAHDLRGPLSAPLFVLQRLTCKLQGDERSLAERGVRSLQRADALIADLLMFARAAAAPDPDAHASLAEAVSGALQDVEQAAAAAHVSVDVGTLPDRNLCCAPGVLSSIVANLVGNAIKYMPPDCGERLVCVRGADVPTGVHVEVSDTGPGIAAGAKDRIFDPYVRADSTRPGLGLGLATVKRLVQAHGGRVGVRSEPGKGAVFWFELPARAA